MTAQEEAQKLFDEGWVQKSRKYRKVRQVGGASGADPFTMLKARRPDVVEHILEQAVQFMQNEARRCLWHYGEDQELSPPVFEEFRKLTKTAMDEKIQQYKEELREAHENTPAPEPAPSTWDRLNEPD